VIEFREEDRFAYSHGVFTHEPVGEERWEP